MMKKLFTLLVSVMATLQMGAKDYNEPMVVTVNGISSEQTGIVTIVQNGDNYDLTLKNLVLPSADGPTGVGNVALTAIVPTNIGDAILLQTQQTVSVTAGDDPSVASWMGPDMEPVPVNLVGKLENDHLRCFLQIDMTATMQQVIDVTVGKGYQFQNAGFENWHTSSGDYNEPNGWHSFESATGSLASLAGHHIKKADDAHSGTASACIFSTSVFGIVSNGTMTTGRLNAGSMTATDVINNSYLDMSKTDVDGNGDPFYTPLYSRPDSIAVWVKFKQGTPNAEYPYATIRAVITDGTYYQDPEDKDYTNVVAKAKNDTIAETDGAWVRVTAPFEYTENAVQPQAILVTASTNANSGKGSGGDELYVDDIELIYNAQLTSLKVKGQDVPGFSSDQLSYEIEVSKALTADDIEVVADGKAALIEKKMAQECQVIVYSGDMSKTTTYTIVTKVPTGIIEVQSSLQSEVRGQGCYNLNGQRVTAPQQGIYIVNGKKVLKK